MPRLLIRNAQIARPDGSLSEGDLLCEHGTIARIDSNIATAADEVIEADGLMLMPGVIDPQVHFREPGKEYKEDLASGSRAAIKGGVTSFLEMPNTQPPTISQAALDDKLKRAANRCVANYGFFIGATRDNLDVLNNATPVCGIKIFMGSSTGNLLVDDDESLERIFANGSRLIAVHAEDEGRLRQRMQEFKDRTDIAAHSEIRDVECALMASERALALAKRYRRRLHILHLSTKQEVALLRHEKPAWVTAEAVPNHLLLSVDDYERQGSRVQMNPPVRTPDHCAALWQGLHDGVLDFIATDHAPHTLDEKKQPYPKSPAGMPGVETSLPLMLSQMRAGKCTLAEILQWMCVGPAEAYRIPMKGKLVEGWDADLTLVDLDTINPVRDEDMFTKTRWSPFQGWKLSGWPIYTIVNGAIVYERGKIREGIYGQPLHYETAG